MRTLAGKLFSRPFLLVALAGLVLNLSGTWLLPLIDRDEPRFAEAAREMAARPDWVVPTFNGAPRYDKPPLIYWAQIGSYAWLGQTALAARLPAAIFATATALLILAWGRRFAAPNTALGAAFMFLTCGQMAIHGRLAVADVPMVCFVAAACWSGWEASRPGLPARGGWWAFFFISLALGFLAKGPVAWLPLVGLGIARWRRPGEFVMPLGTLVLGLAGMVALIAVWGVPALARTHSEFFKVGVGHHVVDRAFVVLEGHGAAGWLGWLATLPFFGVLFYFSFFPWALRFPQALRLWWPRRETDVLGRYLLLQSGLVFAVFTLLRTKLPHYTLPAFPCLALWLAKVVAEGDLPPLPVWRWSAGMAAFIITVTLAIGLLLQPWFPAHALLLKTRPLLRPEMAIATVDHQEPSVVWEFRSIVTNQVQFITAGQAAGFLAGGPAVLILPSEIYTNHRAQWPSNLTVFQVKGIIWSKGMKTELTALIHQ